MKRLLDATTKIALSAMVAGGTVATGALAQDWEHFTCYQIDPHGGFEEREVKLRDQFGEYVAVVLRPVQLCNPVDKNGEGIVDRERHLVCYEIKADPQGRVPNTIDVNTANQFVEQSMTAVIPPRTLCVPSKKERI